MQHRRVLQFIFCMIFWAGITAAMAQESKPAVGSIVEENGVITLAPGPNIDGLVFLHGAVWNPEVIKAFNEIPWLDAGSIRLGWGQVELKDQEFNWKPFDDALAVVKKYNEEHPDAHRILHIRVMAGKNCPKWMEAAGVKYYDTLHSSGKTIHLPKPYDNPEYMKQLRELYRAMYERYKDEPEVAVYHGTWSGALWAEIFHPKMTDPLPEDYTVEKFQQGMVEQTDILIDEFCMRGKVGEMAFSGIYPDKKDIDIVGPVVDRAVERLGKRSPFLYISNNGWGMTGKGTQTPSWGHEEELDYAFGKLNCAFQALGMNKNKKEGVAMSQGDWIPLVDMLKKYDAAYAEVYSPDFMPLDTKHHIEEAFNGRPSSDGSSASAPTTASSYLGYRPWLKQWNRLRYVREGKSIKEFQSDTPRRIGKLDVLAETPEATSMKSEVRVRLTSGEWSEWTDASDLANLEPTTAAELKLTLHTDDGYFTPTVKKAEVVWE